MEFISKEEITETLQKFIDARKNKTCSKTSVIEKTAFEYALAIVNKAKVYEFDQDV